MTLILTCLADDYIVQVSDRRLTLASDPAQATSDHTNKAIFLDGRYIFGFTGLAQLSGQRADLWFAAKINTIKDMPLVDRLKGLGRLLPGAIRYAPPQYRTHAFVGAGFARAGQTAPIEPIAVQLSNFLKRDGRPTWPSDKFDVIIRRIPPGKDFLVLGAGAELNLSERTVLLRSIRKARRAGAGIQSIARILAEMIWKVARRNTTVGNTVMICTLPRSALGPNGEAAEGTVGGIKFNSNEASFYYLGPEALEGTFFGPTVVSPGSMMTDIELRFGTADKPAEPRPEIAAIHYQGANGTKTPPDAPCPCGSGQRYKGCHDQS